MAQYKVIQDIEAEDKLLGPFSLRQFIYLAITVGLGFLSFKMFTSSAWYGGFIFLPPALFFGLLSAPIGDQQSSEIWLLAKIRFFLKPRIRIWDQSGLKQLVTITAPKKIEKQLTKGFSSDEVKSRLKTLSSTLDTRGWAIKNATNLYATSNTSEDRLFDISTQDQSAIAIEPTPDILDPESSPRAQAMEELIDVSAKEHRQVIDENIKKYADEVRRKSRLPFQVGKVNEESALNEINKQVQQIANTEQHMKVLDVPGATPKKPEKLKPNNVTAKANPAILNLVNNSEGLSVRTVANEAQRLKKRQEEDEVVISLH